MSEEKPDESSLEVPPYSALYLLLCKEHRVSRSVRVNWLFNNLYQKNTDWTTDVKRKEREKEEDEDHKEGDGSVLDVLWSNTDTLTPSTSVQYIAQNSSLVFVIDMTPSMMQVSNETFCVKLDEAVAAFDKCLCDLIQPMMVGETSIEPHLCVTVLVYNGTKKPVEVLLQGIHLQKDNINQTISFIKEKLHHLETKPFIKDSISSNDPLIIDATLEGIIKIGILSIQLLSRTDIKGIVVLTDGVGGFATPTSMHTIVNQLRSTNISCWVVLCGGGASPRMSLGGVVDTQALEHLTKSCNGCVLDPAKISKSVTPDSGPVLVNPVQSCILMWSLQHSAWEGRVGGVAYLSSAYEDPFVPQSEYKYQRTLFKAPGMRLIGCRIREGFLIKNIVVNNSEIEILMDYQWQPNITIQYTLQTSFPLSDVDFYPSVITISFTAPYHFVRDFLSEPDPRTALPHAAALKRFKQSLKSISHSDDVLLHLLSFSSVSDYYKFPQSILDGMPLLTIPANQSKPVLAINTDGDDKSLLTLANYWKSLCTLDINHWTHWFHTYKIPLVLHQDSSLPLHLLCPSPSGRYSSVQCRVSASKLFSLLRVWSTIVLQENHSYVRIIPDPASPAYFCLARLVQMQPCMLIHLGFLEGTPWEIQQEAKSTLKNMIAGLKFSLSTATSEKIPNQKASRYNKKRGSLAVPQELCATLINKQLQRVLVTYHLGDGGDVPLQWGYLRHRRWQWRVSQPHPQLLMALLRRRVQEGFVIARTHNGIVTLVVEIQVKQPSSVTVQPCLLQYVISPITCNGSFSTEVWIEPQHKIVSGTPQGLKYLMEKNVLDVHYEIHSVDVEVLTALCSFLEYSPSLPPPPPPNLPSPHEVEASSFDQLETGQLVELQFNLSSLYPKCHVSAFTFSAFTESNLSSSPITLDNCSPQNRFLHSRFIDLLQQNLSYCAKIPVNDPALILNRLNLSDGLGEFIKLFDPAHEGSRLLWRCFASSIDETLFVVFTPCFLCPTSNLTALCLPLVVMVTNLSTLLGPDKIGGAVEPLPPDVHINELFTSTGTRKTTPTIVKEMRKLLKHTHKLAFLHSLQFSLQQSSKINEDDLKQGLKVCHAASIPIDITPLLIGVCHHVCFSKEEEERVTFDSLAVLLELLGDQRRSSFRKVSLIDAAEAEESCPAREDEIKNIINLFFSSLGFQLIRNCEEYYWYCERQKESYTFLRETTPTTHLYEEEEEGQDKSPSPLPSSPDTTLKPKPLTIPPPVPDSESEDETWELEPILSPTSDTISSPVQVQQSPLFLELSYSLKHCTPLRRREEREKGEDSEGGTVDEGGEGEKKEEKEIRVGSKELKENILTEPVKEGRLPLCLRSLLSSLQLDSSSNCSLQLNLTFYSLLDSDEGGAGLDEGEELKEEEEGQDTDPISVMQNHFQRTATSLKYKVEWLVQDEVLSRSRELVSEGEAVSPSLLQSVASHVQSSSGKYVNCLFNHEQVKFVFGAQNSMNQFLQQLQDIKLTTFNIHKANDDYFYLTPSTHSTSYLHLNSTHRHSSSVSPFHVPGNREKRSLHGRCSTPSPLPASSYSRTKRHKRSVSWTATSSLPSHLSPLPTGPQSRSSVSSTDTPVGTVDYDASRSESITSFVLPLSPINNSLSEELFWIVMRVLPSKVEVYIHNRCTSKNLLVNENTHIKRLCHQILSAIGEVCKRTNQWHLLKELLDTHVCSPLLLPESQSDEWVRRTITHHGDIICGGERFCQQQFECDRQWRHHITPHWRLRTMKNQTPLRITRNALNAFAVTNRQDIYVLQDVTEGGEETIFYLKISESLCEVEGDFDDDVDGVIDDGVRCDTRATNEVETISISSVGESQLQSLKHLSSSTASLTKDTKPCESIVLELFGITIPSETLKSRLQRVIQLKLDDAALEMMCSSYTRNLRLFLSPADVEFLQPSPDQPSEVVSLLLSQWIRNPNTFFFYLLQQLSLMFLQPQYTQVVDNKERVLLKTPSELSKVLIQYSLPLSLEQDYLFLYIRPVSKGRGMALISASLVSPEGTILPPFPGLNTRPHPLPVPPTPDETTLVETVESFPVKDDVRCSAAFHIWERGNVALPELKQKLVLTVQRALLDTLLESHYLQLPVATITEEEIEKRLSPGLLRASINKTATSTDQGSYVNLTFDSSVESTSVPPSADTSFDTLKTSSFSEVNEDDAREETGGKGDWEQREKLRRIQSTREHLLNQARCGLLGNLSEDYTSSFPPFLLKMEDFTSPILHHQEWALPSNYSIPPLLSHSISYLSSSLSEMTFSLFKYNKSKRTYSWVSLPSDKALPKTTPFPSDYVLIGRDLQQWKESFDSADPTKHFEEAWPRALRCLPLASWKEVSKVGVVVPPPPLQVAAKKHNCFVSRHQFFMGIFGRGKFEVWMYNISETRLRTLKAQLSSLVKWQRTRVGFLHQLLSQKVGLFHHTTGKDIAPSVQLANQYCTTPQNVATLVKQSRPPIEEVSSSTPTTRQFSRSAPPTPQIEIDSFYQDKEPLSPLSSKHSDPVTCHGWQFREMLTHQRDTVKQRELLGKVFESWEQRGIDYSAPISSEIIAKLKRTSRLLHFCSSPLLFFSEAKSPSLSSSKGASEGEGGAKGSGASIEEQSWIHLLKEKFLNEYLGYLQTLKFHPINERPPAAPRSRHTPSPSHSPHATSGSLGLYKCLQRSWSNGGIMLIELVFKGTVFHVMLYSIECSRIIKTHVPTEVSGLFSQECGRMKDYIHVHSFTYDFHIRTILSIIQKRTRIDGTLNLHHLLDRFCRHYQNPPHYIRNRICKETLSMTLSVTMDSLMKHLLSNCKDYSLDTLELLHMMTDGSESSTTSATTLYEVALMIDLASIGNVTTPEISRLIYDTRDQYHVIILAVLANGQSDSSSAHNKKALLLSMYMILVNKVDMFPRFTLPSSLISRNSATKIASPVTSLGNGGGKMETLVERESTLNASVRDHRRKLGYGSLNTPSAGSEVVINVEIIEEEMNGLKRHFINIINSAQSHVRRNELWKRLLYGGGGNKIMEGLSVVEFQELLQLATCCRLETIDPQLAHLQKQNKKWYQGLFQLFQDKFHHMYKSFTSKANGAKYGIIINEDWQDMLLLLVLDDDGAREGGGGVEQGFSCVYRNPKEGAVSQGQRNISAYVEAENRLVSAVVNALCGSLWLKMINETPAMAKSPKNTGGRS